MFGVWLKKKKQMTKQTRKNDPGTFKEKDCSNKLENKSNKDPICIYYPGRFKLFGNVSPNSIWMDQHLMFENLNRQTEMVQTLTCDNKKNPLKIIWQLKVISR